MQFTLCAFDGHLSLSATIPKKLRWVIEEGPRDHELVKKYLAIYSKEGA